MAEAQSARAYLLECCALDAAEDAERILALRRARRSGLGHKEDTSLDRRSLEAEFEAIRRDFYSVELDELTKQLSELNPGPFLDLERYLRRLQRVAAAREALTHAEADKAVDSAFLESFRGILILPIEERRPFRAKVERHFRGPDSRRSARQSVARLRKVHPAVFELDPEWLGQFISKQKEPRGRLFRGPKFLWWIGVMITVRFIIRLLVNDD